MPVPEVQEPTDGEGSRGRNKNQNKDHKRKEEQDSELVVATSDAGQAGDGVLDLGLLATSDRSMS